MKPNLLNFANEALLHNAPYAGTQLVTYNMNTGETTPDTGYYIPLVEKQYPGVDKELIREFWKENSDLLANKHLCIGIIRKGAVWVFSVGEHVDGLQVALEKSEARGFEIWNNKTKEEV